MFHPLGKPIDTLKNFIVLVEDDVDDQQLITEELQKLAPDIDLCVFARGSIAVQFLNSLSENQVPLLVLLDYNLPEESGASILLQINQLKQFEDVVKVVWSTSSSSLYETKCLQAGAHSYIVKPDTIEGIVEVAHHLLGLCKRG